ncbi:MAG: hypothetical protein V8Q75_06460 [Bacilli bacterium]
MIVKVQHHNSIEKEIYSNVENIFISHVECGDLIELQIKDKEAREPIFITKKDDNGNYPAIVSAVWLMNDKGQTIERLV